MNKLLTALILSLPLAGGFAHAEDLAAQDAALVREANVALTQKDYKTAFEKFSILAAHGKPAAQFNLGAFYLNGQGVQKDEKLAYEWLGKAAAQGYPRASQVIENAAARGNAYAQSELRKLQGLPEPEAVAPVQEKPLSPEKPQPQAQSSKRSGDARGVYGAPTVGGRSSWAFGVAADYSRLSISEPLYYSVGGTLNSKTPSYSSSQPGVSFWAGSGDLTILASYRRGSGTVTSTISGVGTPSRTFTASETEIDVRWLMSDYKSGNVMPYVLAGFILNSTSGTADQLQYQDKYSRKDNVFLVGAGAIIPATEKLGFMVDVKAGADRQKRSGNYTPAAGVTLAFNTYSNSATAGYLHLAGTMYYKVVAGLDVQLGLSHTNYFGGMGSASNTGINLKGEYSFR